MKYYIVSSRPILFKQDGMAIVPPQLAVEKNIVDIFDDGCDSTFAVENINDAIMLASEHNSRKNNDEGFLILEVEKRGRLKKNTYELQIGENETKILNGFNIPSKGLTFLKAHLGHLDGALESNIINLNASYKDIFDRVLDEELFSIFNSDDEDSIHHEPVDDEDLIHHEPADDIDLNNLSNEIFVDAQLDEDGNSQQMINRVNPSLELQRKEINEAIGDIKEKSLVKTLVNVVVGVAKVPFNVARGVLNAITTGIKAILNKVKSLAGIVGSYAMGAANFFFGTGKKVANGTVTAIKAIANACKNIVVRAALGVGRLMIGTGKKIANGTVTTIKAIANACKNIVVRAVLGVSRLIIGTGKKVANGTVTTIIVRAALGVGRLMISAKDYLVGNTRRQSSGENVGVASVSAFHLFLKKQKNERNKRETVNSKAITTKIKAIPNKVKSLAEIVGSYAMGAANFFFGTAKKVANDTVAAIKAIANVCKNIVLIAELSGSRLMVSVKHYLAEKTRKQSSGENHNQEQNPAADNMANSTEAVHNIENVGATTTSAFDLFLKKQQDARNEHETVNSNRQNMRSSR